MRKSLCFSLALGLEPLVAADVLCRLGRRGVLLCLVVGGLFWGSACSGPNGTGSLQGTLRAPHCASLSQKRSFDLRPLRFYLTRRANTLELRIQAASGDPTSEIGAETDLLLLQLEGAAPLPVGEEVTILPYQARLTAEPLPQEKGKSFARAILYLGATCPQWPVPFQVEGSLRFSRLDLQPGATIEGTLRLNLRPPRSSEGDAQGQLEGNFRFVYQVVPDKDLYQLRMDRLPP